MILLSGDIANMPMEYGYDTSEEADKSRKESYKDFQELLKAVSAINEKVYYIPGNVS